MKNIFQVVLVLLCSSCTRSTGYSGIETERASYKFERDSFSETVLQEVLASPTEFFVDVKDSAATWSRAKLFFAKYAKIADLDQVTRVVDNAVLISNKEAPSQRYIIEIKKVPYGSGYNFTVNCRPRASGASSQIALRNAKNISRFLREGTLERSLLEL
jgi:hypothetical protein